MTSTIKKELQSLSPSALIELLVLDLTSLGGEVIRFHAGTNELLQPIVWCGDTYQAWPIEVEGFEISTRGTLPRPRLRVANVKGMFSSEVSNLDDLVGAPVTRKRTFKRFLDAVNFPDGVNEEADPNQAFPDELWYIEQKTSENRYVIEWELASAMDLQGVMLPRRQVIQNTCMWVYRSSECSYTGTQCYNALDIPCSASKDVCGKRLTSCKKRFNEVGAILPFGGFPGAMRVG